MGPSSPTLTCVRVGTQVGTQDGVLDSLTPTAAHDSAPVDPNPAPAAAPNPVPAAAIATGGGGTPLFTPAPTHPLLLLILLLLLLPLVVVVLPHLHLDSFAAASLIIAPTCLGAFAVVHSLAPPVFNCPSVLDCPLHLIAPCTWFIHTGLVHGCSSSFMLDFGCLHSFSHLLLS